MTSATQMLPKRLTRETLVGAWAGLPVAWTASFEFDEAAYREDVARCCRAGVSGVYTGGTTGEFYAQDWDDFQRIARATVEECRTHKTPVMIGCTATSTRGAARRAAFAAEIGANAIQVALPFWMEVIDSEIVGFFKAIALAAQGLPLSIYETRRSRKTLTVTQHLKIRETVAQYLMVKATAGTVGDTVEGCTALSSFINVFVAELRWAELGPCGAIGSCSAMVYWNPCVVLRMWRNLVRKKWDDLTGQCFQAQELHKALVSTFAGRGFTDSAYDRMGARVLPFLRTSLNICPPYPSPDEADVRAMRGLFESYFPDMLLPIEDAAQPNKAIP